MEDILRVMEMAPIQFLVAPLIWILFVAAMGSGMMGMGMGGMISGFMCAAVIFAPVPEFVGAQKQAAFHLIVAWGAIGALTLLLSLSLRR